MKLFTKLFCTTALLAGALSVYAQNDEVIDFDASFYHNWSEVSATATDNGPAGGGVVIGEEVAMSATIWGNLSGAVPYLDYANITEYSELRFEGTPGAVIRLMCNRTVNEGPIYEIKPTIGDDGKLTVSISDLKYLNGGVPCDFVCLQSIKVPAGWQGGTTAATITSIKIVKPGDPLSIPKENLKNEINDAKMRTAIGKTEDSWNALQQAIADAESALAASDATEESLTTAKNTLYDAKQGLTLAEGYTNLTSDMYFNWSDPQNPVAVDVATVLYTSTGQPYGDGSVKYFNYADISDYDKLIIGVAAGTPRIMMNRAEPLEEGADGYDPNGGAYVQITDEPVDGVVVVDLKQWDYAHLNAIKGANWVNVTVTDLLLYKEKSEPVAVDIDLTVDGGDIAAALASATEGLLVGDIIINLNSEAAYTVGSTLKVPNNLFINGNGATIVVDEAMTDPFITLDGTETFAKKDENTDSDHKLIAKIEINSLAVKGLQNAVVKDAQKTLVENLLITNSVIEMPAAGKNVLDFNGKGYVGKVMVSGSTIWAKDKNTGFFAQYGSRPKNINGEWTQEFEFLFNTIVNIANGKNFCDLKQNGTAQNVYILKNNIFVDCGKNGQTVVGFNKGQQSATPAWDVEGNYFEAAGACTNAAEVEKTGKKGEEDIVKNCVEGKVSFTDAANGDFNGTLESDQQVESLGDPRWTLTLTATAIQTVKAEAASDVMYDLQGRRVLNAQKGMYIINGKKVVK